MVELASGDDVCHLLLHKAVLALREDVRYIFNFIELQRYSQCHGVHLVLEVQGATHFQVHHLVGLCCGKVCKALEVEADPGEGCLVAERDDRRDAVHLAQKINRVAFSVVLHVEGHYLLNQIQQLLHVCFLLSPLAVLLGNLARQVTDVLVAPAGEPLLCSIQPVLQALAGPRLLHRGRQDGEKIRKEALEAALRHLCVMLSQSWVVRAQELQWFGDRGHGTGGGLQLRDHCLEGQLCNASISVLCALY
mmetsp:Transcript_135737/g.378178  ORF Transcript_135737/g.378178 Transcript_135737/m.378178 type:complete len:249 (+) Transcript_135737:1837-2583(+)